MSMFTRRKALLGIASLSAPAAAAAAPGLHVPLSTWEGYARRTPAVERLQHHLLSAALTADEMCPDESTCWNVIMIGEAGLWNPSFVLTRWSKTTDDILHAQKVVCQFSKGKLV